MSNTTVNQFVASGTTTERLAFTPDPPTVAALPNNGYTYWDTTLQALYAWDVGASDWVAAGGGTGTVTNTGTLTDHALIVGNGGVDVSALASLGTTTTVLHGNAAGDPTFGAVALATDVSGTLPTANLSTAQQTRQIVCSVDGGGSAITTGVKADLQVEYACTITAWSVLLDQSGSIVFDIWKDTQANYPPTIADTITASTKPTVSSATNASGSPTSWTTSISAGDCLRFNVDSITTATRAVLILTVTVS